MKNQGLVLPTSGGAPFPYKFVLTHYKTCCYYSFSESITESYDYYYSLLLPPYVLDPFFNFLSLLSPLSS